PADSEGTHSKIPGTFRQRSVQKNLQPQSRSERPRSSGSGATDPHPLAPRRNEKSERYSGRCRAFPTRIFRKLYRQVQRVPARSEVRSTETKYSLRWESFGCVLEC